MLTLESVEKLKRDNALINSIKKNLENENDELKTQNGFVKEKYEKEINLKNKEIEEIRTNALFCLNILVNRDIESYIKSKVWT